MTGSERKLIAQIAAHTSWANTTNRSTRTEKARRALLDKFLVDAGGNADKAESLRRAYYAKLALRSVQDRRRSKELASAADAAESELRSLGESPDV